METAIKDMSATVTKCNDKVEKIMPTDEVLKVVNNTIDGTLQELRQKVKDLTSTLDMKFEMLYADELYEPRKFGPFDGA